MLFKDLKEGYQIFVLDKNGIEVTEGRIESITPPHFDNHYGGNDAVVDLVINAGSKNLSYSFKANTETGYTGSLVITTSRETITREVEATKNQVDMHIANYDKYKSCSEKCNKILSEFSPAFREKAATEERFIKIESSVNDIKGMIKDLFKELKS